MAWKISYTAVHVKLITECKIWLKILTDFWKIVEEKHIVEYTQYKNSILQHNTTRTACNTVSFLFLFSLDEIKFDIGIFLREEIFSRYWK